MSDILQYHENCLRVLIDVMSNYDRSWIVVSITTVNKIAIFYDVSDVKNTNERGTPYLKMKRPFIHILFWGTPLSWGSGYQAKLSYIVFLFSQFYIELYIWVWCYFPFNTPSVSSCLYFCLCVTTLLGERTDIIDNSQLVFSMAGLWWATYVKSVNKKCNLTLKWAHLLFG